MSSLTPPGQVSACVASRGWGLIDAEATAAATTTTGGKQGYEEPHAGRWKDKDGPIMILSYISQPGRTRCCAR